MLGRRRGGGAHSRLPYYKNRLERCMCRLNKTKDGGASGCACIGCSLRQNKKYPSTPCGRILKTAISDLRYLGKIHVDARFTPLKHPLSSDVCELTYYPRERFLDHLLSARLSLPERDNCDLFSRVTSRT